MSACEATAFGGPLDGIVLTSTGALFPWIEGEYVFVDGKWRWSPAPRRRCDRRS